MYRLDTAKERIARIEAALKNIQAQLEQDKINVAELSWPDIEQLKRIVVLLEVAEITRHKNLD